MRLRIIQIIFLSVLIVVYQESALANHKLRYKFKPKEKYSYSLTIRNTMTGRGAGQDFTISTDSQIDFVMSGKQSRDSLFSVIVTLKKFKSKINAPDMGFNDTTVVMKDWNGKRFKFTMNDVGNVISTSAVDNVTPSELQMTLHLNPIEIIENVFFELPSQDVDMKGTWKKNDPDTLDRGGIKVVERPELNLIVQNIEKVNNLNCYKILIDGSSTLKGSSTGQLINITVDGKTKVSGTCFFAEKEGLLVGIDQSSESNITQTLSGQHTGTQTMTVKNTLKVVLRK